MRNPRSSDITAPILPESVRTVRTGQSVEMEEQDPMPVLYTGARDVYRGVGYKKEGSPTCCTYT